MVYCTENREMVENVVIIGGLIAVQFVYAGNSVLLSYLMSLGLHPLSLIIFSTFATFLVLSPICLLFERCLPNTNTHLCPHLSPFSPLCFKLWLELNE